MIKNNLDSLVGSKPFDGAFSDSIIAAVSTRSDGNMSLSYGDSSKAVDNRKLFLTGLGIDCQALVCAKQVHSGCIKRVSAADKGRGALTYDDAVSDTDAFVTDIRSIPLAIFTADCLSVFIYDSRHSAVGVIHAGWRSSKENIVSKTIEFMKREFGSNPQDLYTSFGPAIRKCCYEVGAELEKEFPGYVLDRNNSFYLDLIGVNAEQIVSAGIKKERIFDCGVCTVCQNADYFSYRKENNQAGRIMSVIMIK